MYTRIQNIWENFRSSFWFTPSILMLLATFGACVLIAVDYRFRDVLINASTIFEMSPAAARSILSSIVGAMISATGVVFSMTIVALSLASSQFGSRLVRTFRTRRSTHFTLGIFVSTSLYCILVLSSIRDFGEGFVPTLSVFTGILLTVVCLITLIYYIHDISYAIQASSVVDRSAIDLHKAMKRLFPKQMGSSGKEDSERQTNHAGASTDREWEKQLGEPLWTTKCDRVGYLQAIENESVMALAEEQKLIFRLMLRPGDFIHPEVELAKIFEPPKRDAEIEIDREAINKELCTHLIVGRNRTPTQDIRYAFDELTEVAVRALSPGINDPFTALNCVDRITAALHELKACERPSRYRLDEEGDLRVIADPVTFDCCLEKSLGVIEHYADGSPMVEQRVAFSKKSLADD